MSDPLSMTFGVLQESILGPLLFPVNINDLPLALNNCEVALYSDFAREPHLLEETLISRESPSGYKTETHDAANRCDTSPGQVAATNCPV